jgi:orotate phosphoribosyltransferase
MSALPSAFAAARLRLLELMRALSFERRAVTLASGKTSDFYVDSKQTVLSAEGHFLVGRLFLELVETHAPAAEAVGGLTMGADPLASAVATLSFLAGRPRHAFYVRKEPKGHGTQKWLEGDKVVRPGTPVAIVEDVCTTGGSSLKAVERARIHGLDVKRVFALVDREEGGREAVEKEVPLTALFKASDFR